MVSATWPAKAWPAGRISDCWHQCRQEGWQPLIIPGPGDEGLMDELAQSVPAEGFAPDTNLLELADLLSHCDAFAGTDCGGRHLAACLGLPTVTVFGPTDADGWNPGHPRHVSIRMDLDCLGCDLKTCPLPGHPCLDDLPAERVIQGLKSVLAPEMGGSERASP